MIGREVVNTVWNGDSDRIGAEVVIVDKLRDRPPTNTRILEVANEFAFLCVDADDRHPPMLKPFPQIADVKKLLIPVWTGICWDLLAVDTQRVSQLMKKPGHGVGTDLDAVVRQCRGDSAGGNARPLQPSDRISSGVVIEQVLDQRDDVGSFFSMEGRPPPWRRVLPVATS